MSVIVGMMKKEQTLNARVVIVLTSILFTACSSLTHNANYRVLAEHNLPRTVTETSGLYCPENGFAYTVNDSGNKASIYKIDNLGHVVDERSTELNNIDWEALTGDKTYFYIGDIGNNNGKRESVKIHKMVKGGLDEKVNTLSIHYANNQIKNNAYLNHDFDAEALVSMDEHLFLFSKSWQSANLLIYRLDKATPKQSVIPVANIDNLPGMITGADYDHQHARFILVGYQLKSLGRFYPFITILDKQLNLVRSFELEGYKQIEGLCVTPSGDVWLTQEGSFLFTNKMIQLKIVE